MYLSGYATDVEVPTGHLQPKDRYRIAIVLAELKGPAAALRYLQDLGSDGAEDATIGTLAAVYSGAEPDSGGRERLVEELGWFGSVAATYGKPADDPGRMRMMTSVRDYVVRQSVLMLALILLVLLGCILAARAAWRGWQGRFPLAYPDGTEAPHGSGWIEGFAVYLLVFFLFSALVAWIVPPAHRLAANWGFLLLAWIPLWWVGRRGIPATGWSRSLGFHRGAGWGQECLSGLTGYLIGIPVILLGVLATMGLHQIFPSSHPIGNIFSEGIPATPMLVNIIGLVCIFAPLVEETMFRGMAFHHLAHRRGVLVACVGSALMFAALHPQGIAGIPALMSVGLVLAGIRVWRHSLVACMAAHAFHNGIQILIALVFLS